MQTKDVTKPIGKFGSAIGKGLIAGFVGTVAITASQMIEMKLTKREGSTVPADAVSKVLHVRPTSHEAKQKFSQEVHWTYGTLWGIARGMLSLAGVKRWTATTAHFAAVLGTAMIIEPKLKVAPPIKEWSKDDILKDILHHAVYAIAAGIVYDALMND